MPSSNPWPWRALTALLLLTAASLQFLWLVHDCPLELAPDEAHYWDWSRHLDWSYYSKGPLVAYLIRGGVEWAGPWAEQVAGSAMPAVRLPALFCGVLLLISLYVLTTQVYHDERLAALVVAVLLTLPATVAVSSIMTIDAPYLCCWGWALVLAHRAVFGGAGWAWLAAGLVVGAGILAKYTMVVFLPALGLFLLTSRAYRQLLLRPGFWTMAVTAGLCCIPILVWNARHDWVTFRHVNGLTGLNQQATTFTWLGPLAYIGTQFALLLGFWFVVWTAALVAHPPWRESDAGVRYLWWLSAPMFGLFLAFSIKTGGGEPNWPATAYLSGMVLAIGWLVDHWQRAPAAKRFALGLGLGTTCILGLALGCFLHYPAAFYPVLGRLADRLFPDNALALRRLDPTCRLRGWQTLALEIDRQQAELRRLDIEPVLATAGWSLPGELGFYCARRPTVYSIGLAAGDRHSQYDLWRPNPLADPEDFRGRTFIVVGYLPTSAFAAFEEVDPPMTVTATAAGRPVNSWTVMICRGFRGFPALPERIVTH